MSCDLYASLAWLPKAPEDFRLRCRALDESVAPGRDLKKLARYALDESRLRQLAEAVARLRKRGASLEPLSSFKLAIIGDGTLLPLVPAIVASAVRHGIALDASCSEFGQAAQEAFSSDSELNRSRPDAVLIVPDFRGIVGNVGTADPARLLGEIRDAVHMHSGAPCIVQTIAPPPETLFGNFERRAASSVRSRIDRFNAKLLESFQGTSDVLFDVASVAETVGLADWHSPTQWHLAKFGFDGAFIPLYADHVARILGAMRGTSRRCLILDLDNTIWGGVVGDDGVEGLLLGQGDPTGEAFLDLQRAALALRDRGIVLAVCSKNEAVVAKAAFEDHPEMLLKLEHITVFRANWEDKASNIVAIANELALGLDAMVLLDDNPAERALVRDVLPDVAVPELPADPALFARTLSAAGYFETVAFSDEDRRRADLYRANAKRAELAGAAPDIDAYLASLEMRIILRPFDAAGRTRITQLINKSNQFNLTTRRYSDIDVEQAELDPSCFTVQARLIDAFGDNGMISVVIARALNPQEWEIDTWLMSCRVLGRRVEHALLRELLQHARDRGVRRIFGTFRPTGRNGLVRDHYVNLGFSQVGEDPDGTTRWEIATNVEPPAVPMVVDSAGFKVAAAT